MPEHDLGKLVSMGTRIKAFLWDYIVIFVYILLLIGLSYAARPWLMPLFSSSPWTAELTGFGFITLPVLLYFALSEGSRAHATWGKRKVGIQVTTVHGQPMGFGTSLLRSAVKFAPWELAHFTIWHMVLPSGIADSVLNWLLAAVYGLVFLYLVSPLWSPKKQTVYDRIAGSVVVRSDKA